VIPVKPDPFRNTPRKQGGPAHRPAATVHGNAEASEPFDREANQEGVPSLLALKGQGSLMPVDQGPRKSLNPWPVPRALPWS